MGRISDWFAKQTYKNEAEVSQNFFMPLFVKFLGYHQDELIPEHLLPPISIPLNRNKSVSSSGSDPRSKPDYIVNIQGQGRIVVCDSKGPNEDVDEYINQLLAYSIATKVNFLLVTNGSQLKIYDANRLIFSASSIGDLDIKSGELFKLLSRQHVITSTEYERVQNLDLSVTLSKNDIKGSSKDVQVALKLSDYMDYLQNIGSLPLSIDIPLAIKEAFNIVTEDFEPFPPEELYNFDTFGLKDDFRSEEQLGLSYKELLRVDISFGPLLIIGESGLGKSTLANQLRYDRTQLCLSRESDLIPVVIKLGQYTATQNILNLIALSLNSRGAHINHSSIDIILQKNRFLIILDAFDEVIDINVTNLEREIATLLDNYPNCQLIVTTRHFRLPRISGIKKYELRVLTSLQIEKFVKKYLPESQVTFLLQLKKSNLQTLASNTLILVLLIFLYQADRTLPKSRGRVLSEVVSKVLKFNRDKHSRHHQELRSSILEDAFCQIALIVIERGASYVLDNEEVDKLMFDIIDNAKEQHLVQSNLTLDEFLDQLCSTGFVYRTDEGTVFWHRAFVEYFAAWGLAKEGHLERVANELAQQVNWVDVIPLYTFHLSDPNSFIESLLQVNLFIAAKAINENSQITARLLGTLLDALEQRCSSSWYYVRRTAMTLLLQQDELKVSECLLRLVDSKYVDIKCEALVEVAKRHLPNAKQIVMQNVDWDVARELHIFMQGGSITSIIDALSEFDDVDTQLKIVDIWKSKPDIFTSMYCKEALYRVHKRGTLQKQVVEDIFNFFLVSDNDEGLSKTWRIKELLSDIQDDFVAEQLIAIVAKTDDTSPMPFEWHGAEVLAAYNESTIINKIIKSYKDKSTKPRGRELLAHALSKGSGNIPNEIIFELATSSNYEIMSCGVSALKRFKFEEAKDVLLQSIHPPLREESYRTQHAYAKVQEAAFEVLAYFEAIHLLLQPENKFEYYYDRSIEALFRSIRKTRNTELLQLVDDIVENAKSSHVIVEAAWTYAEVGFIEKAETIIEQLWSDNRNYTNATSIIEGIHMVSSQKAETLIQEFLDHFAGTQHSSYIRFRSIVALGRVGTEGACDILANIAWESAHSSEHILDAENALRSMQPYFSTNRETWLIQLLNTGKLERHHLRRALENLGVAGTMKSIPLLEEYLRDSDPNIQFMSFWAMTEIYRRDGILWFNDEEKLS